MTGFQVIGTHDVAISSGKDTSISSAEEYERHDYAKQVKKSGLLSGGGLGFTIGTEKRKDQYSDADILQKGSTVGSISGNVTITSDKDIHVNASDIITGKDISMTGENINISSKDNIYHSEEKHEYKKSGLTVSVGGAGIEAIESVAAPATRMTEVSDHRLKALYGYETAEKIKENGDALKAAAKGEFSPTVSIGISSSSSKSESHSTITEAQGSSLQAGQDMTIKTKEDLNVKGSDIVGNHIHLEADNDIHIWATEEKETQKSSQSSKGGSLGVSLSAGSVVSVDGKFYAGKGKENGSTTSYRASTVNANDTLTMKSGKDTDLIGSTVSGNKVKADVDGNLNIESLQTKKEYSEENISAGMSFSTAAGKTSYGGSASKGNMKSHYESVINQAGIRAGGEGFDISVKENTDLKGGVIDSAASKDKNTLTTGTLSWEDKENKADYKAGGMGVSYSPNNKSSKLNQRGLTPNLTPTVKDNADSTTKSAVAEGTIHITNKEKQKQDISSLNRDTKNSLNQLQEIFNKTKVEERQELRGILEQYGNEFIHQYSEKKGWIDGSSEKTALHALWSGLMSQMSGGNAFSGSVSGGMNEFVLGYLEKTEGKEWMLEHPDLVQAVSVGLGATLGTLTGDIANSAYTTHMGTKWNQYENYPHMKEQIERELETEDYKGLPVGAAKVIYTDETQQHGVIIVKDSASSGRIIDLNSITGAGEAFGYLYDNGELHAYQENKGYYPTGHPNAEKSYYNLGEQDGYVLNGHPLYNSDINGIAWDKSQEFLASKGLSWSTANWFEARYGYLSRQEAEMVGVNIANTTLKVWGQIAYLKEVIRNHQRFDTLQDALKADGYDTIPFSAGIVTIGVLSRFNPEIGFIGGVLGGIGSNIYINQKKEELKKAESGDPSNSDAKSKNSEV
ncbi:MAG: hemagglutinin repeat-containing protein [Dialister sp.]|nr:hemagglutinin repeat-containing protein [Dialister sp.]